MVTFESLFFPKLTELELWKQQLKNIIHMKNEHDAIVVIGFFETSRLTTWLAKFKLLCNYLKFNWSYLTYCPKMTHEHDEAPRQNDHNSADNIFKCISMNENYNHFIQIALKFVPIGLADYAPSLV